MLEQIQKLKLKSGFTSLNSYNPIIEIAQKWIYLKKNSISKEEKIEGTLKKDDGYIFGRVALEKYFRKWLIEKHLLDSLLYSQ